MIGAIDKFFERLTAYLALMGGLGLFIAIAVTCLSSFLRFAGRALDFSFGRIVNNQLWQFLSPILGEEEIVTYAIGAALFAFLPWAMLKRGHIRINIFQGFFPLWFNRLLDVLADGSLAFVAYMVMMRQWFLIFKKGRRSQDPMLDLIFTGQWPEILSRLRVNSETQILGLKQWPFYAFAEFCVFVFFVIAFYCTLRRLFALFSKTKVSLRLKFL